jgi:hypothetical protein
MRSWRLVDEWEDGFGWVADERLGRTSHAFRAGGRVWLTDPVDAPELEERVRALGSPAGVLQLLDRHRRDCATWARRLGVPHLCAWRDDVPFAALRVRRNRLWREVALWHEPSRTLVCADALGTVGYFCAPRDRVGLHPLLRPFPPHSLGTVEPARILCGHGPGIHDDATDALREALSTARRRLPAALLGLLRTSGSAAST